MPRCPRARARPPAMPAGCCRRADHRRARTRQGAPSLVRHRWPTAAARPAAPAAACGRLAAAATAAAAAAAAAARAAQRRRRWAAARPRPPAGPHGGPPRCLDSLRVRHAPPPAHRCATASLAGSTMQRIGRHAQTQLCRQQQRDMHMALAQKPADWRPSGRAPSPQYSRARSARAASLEVPGAGAACTAIYTISSARCFRLPKPCLAA